MRPAKCRASDLARTDARSTSAAFNRLSTVLLGASVCTKKRLCLSLALLLFLCTTSLPTTVYAGRTGPLDNRHNSTSSPSGGSKLVPNIVGGTAVPFQYTYPFQADVEENVQGFSCGGSLIAPNLLLTAAHCAFGSVAGSYEISTFRRDLSKTTAQERGNSYSVTKIYIHPNYDDAIPTNDVAVFVLSAPTRYGTFAPQVIGINRDPNFPPAGAMARVIGWGDTADGANQGSSVSFGSNFQMVAVRVRTLSTPQPPFHPTTDPPTSRRPRRLPRNLHKRPRRRRRLPRRPLRRLAG